jgi:hypothetical protein
MHSERNIRAQFGLLEQQGEGGVHTHRRSARKSARSPGTCVATFRRATRVLNRATLTPLNIDD